MFGIAERNPNGLGAQIKTDQATAGCRLGKFGEVKKGHRNSLFPCVSTASACDASAQPQFQLIFPDLDLQGGAICPKPLHRPQGICYGRGTLLIRTAPNE